MRRPVLVALLLAGLVVGYVALRLLSRELDPRYRAFDVTPTAEEARDRGTLLATYRAEPLADDAPEVLAVYAVRPERLTLGPLLQTRAVTADAARVVAKLGEGGDRSSRWLVFEDAAGARIAPDGSVEAGPLDDGTTSASDRVVCCAAVRTRPPDQFWLEESGRRVVRFVRER